MNIRSLRRRIKKARLEVVLNDKNVKICDTFQDLVELYPDGEEPLVKQNPKLKLIYTARYSKMIKDLEKFYIEDMKKEGKDPYADDERGRKRNEKRGQR